MVFIQDVLKELSDHQRERKLLKDYLIYDGRRNRKNVERVS
jgi:hypothetical protein